MIDKKTEDEIKALKGFIELWAKFHSLYSEALSKGVVSSDDDFRFAETRRLMKARYEELKGSLDFKYSPHGRLTDPAADILAVETIRFASEKAMKKLEGDWKDSYIFLNNILEHFSQKKRRLGEFNPVGVFFKRMWERR